jgi:peroxiredoxin Q/BCP
VAYFTASCDPHEGDKGNKAFAESLKLDYPILSDPDKKVAEAYGVVHDGRPFPERWTFYIDKEGVIKFIDQKVSPKDSGKDMVKKLDELGFPKKK